MNYVVTAGFLNAMETSKDCQLWAMCQAGGEAASRGGVGRVVGLVAADNAERWLLRMSSMKGKGVAGAVANGVDGRDCDLLYSCEIKPNHYTFPGI